MGIIIGNEQYIRREKMITIARGYNGGSDCC
jgi:hypothetical protein